MEEWEHSCWGGVHPRLIQNLDKAGRSREGPGAILHHRGAGGWEGAPWAPSALPPLPTPTSSTCNTHSTLREENRAFGWERVSDEKQVVVSIKTLGYDRFQILKAFGLES